MPRKHPVKQLRVALSIDPQLLAALRDYADAMGVPVTRVCIGLLREAQPELGARARLARAFRSGDMQAFTEEAAEFRANA